MKIFSLKLKSVLITAAILLAVTIGVYFMASLVNEAVSPNDRLIPIYDVDKNTNLVTVENGCI